MPAPGSTAGRGGRPEKYCRRAMVDAILYIVRGGTAWRQLPVEFPPAGTVYAVFARWAHSGAWQRILDALRDRLRVRAGRDRCPTVRSSTRRRCRLPIPCSDRAAAGMAAREPAASSGTLPWM
ncbi:transposase [Rhodococcus koreensis]|uniref:transposase n=1 Tax=Rhodococcus koreensis TaxID=99653 RepID=UPI0036DCBF2A